MITSSAISTMIALIEESTSPLFMQFTPLRLLPFGKRTTAELARKLGLGPTEGLAALDDEACALLHDLTGWNLSPTNETWSDGWRRMVIITNGRGHSAGAAAGLAGAGRPGSSPPG